MNLYHVVIVLVTMLLIAYAVTWTRAQALNDYLYGFWVAEGDKFCEESGIESMLIFIGAPVRGWFSTTRSCYIVIMDDVANQGFELAHGAWANGSCSASVAFDDDQLWPERVTLSVDIITGTLRISGDSAGRAVLFAHLHKQHDTTNVARAAEALELVEPSSRTHAQHEPAAQ